MAAYHHFLDCLSVVLLADGGAAAAFDRRVAATPFPPAVTSSTPVRVLPGPTAAVRRIRSHARPLAVSPTGQTFRSRLRELQR